MKKRLLSILLAGTIFVGALAGLGVLSGCAKKIAPPVRATSMNLLPTLEEEFDGERDEYGDLILDEHGKPRLDKNLWSYEIGNGIGGWGNQERQYYTDKNARIETEEDDGDEISVLKIAAKREKRKDSFGNETGYTSSRIITKNKFSQSYGKIEARIKAPAGTGLWPAFWMLPENSPYGGWPMSGEIDIFEGRGREPDRYNATLHTGSGGADARTGKEYLFPENEDGEPGSISDWHTYGIEWKYNEISFLCDDELIDTKRFWLNDDIKRPAPFDTKFFIIINFAIGGSYDAGNEPKEDDPLGDMCVDYVRAYQYEKYDALNEDGNHSPQELTYRIDMPGDVAFECKKPSAVGFEDGFLSPKDYSYNNGKLSIKSAFFQKELEPVTAANQKVVYTHDRKFVVYSGRTTRIFTVKMMKSISTVKEFYAIEKNMNANYNLTCDLDFTGEEYQPLGQNGEKTFGGTLDGRGYQLKNISIVGTPAPARYVGWPSRLERTQEEVGLLLSPNNMNVGLFREISPGGVVRNLCISNMSILAVMSGGIAGTNNGLIENCNVEVNRYDDGGAALFVDWLNYSGGITGMNTETGRIRSCITKYRGLVIDSLIAGRNEGEILYCFGMSGDYYSKTGPTGICHYVEGKGFGADVYIGYYDSVFFIPGKEPIRSLGVPIQQLRDLETYWDDLGFSDDTVGAEDDETEQRELTVGDIFNPSIWDTTAGRLPRLIKRPMKI